MSTLHTIIPTSEARIGFEQLLISGINLVEHSSQYTLAVGKSRIVLTGEELLDVAHKFIRVASYSTGDETLAKGLAPIMETIKEITQSDGIQGESVGYTLGSVFSYDLALEEIGPVSKLGYRPPSEEDPTGYPGGWVWWTPEEASKYFLDHKEEILKTYPGVTQWGVYKLSLPLPYHRCTYNVAQGYDLLLNDARILEKVQTC